MKLLSICVPCYNSEAYMEKCIDSLLAGGPDVEIIIVDDGSRDHTAEIADRYQTLHPNEIRVVHQPNGGHGAAVNTGIANATGQFFKVVDSDDWLKESAYKKVLDTLRHLAGGSPQLDMMICNYVYNKVSEKRHKVIHYHKILPENRIFTWDDCKHFRKGHYILMHSVIFRTKLLRECGLKLPEHTFYVDNLYVFEPLPHVHHMYYLDVNLYMYYIGRVDQSVNQKVMISRMDQQYSVNRRMVDFYTDKANQPAINSNRNLRNYMYSYLEIITAISTLLSYLANTPEALQKNKELFQYVREKDFWLFRKLRYSIIGSALHLPGKGGRAITVEVYKIIRHFYNFN